MSVVVVGLEQRFAPLGLLEQVAIGDADLPKALHRLRDRSNCAEAVVLSTCLRTEVYAVVDRFHAGVDEIQEFLAEIAGTTVGALQGHLAVRFDDEVAGHLFAVAAGLDSAVLGETEVLGQVRRAWERAQREQASGPVLGGLFRHAIQTGKRVRAETAIARGITSLSHGAVALAEERRPGGLRGARIVVVGAGEMGTGVLRALPGTGVIEVAVANRTHARAGMAVAGLSDVLAGEVRVVTLGHLPEVLAGADVVFAATGAPHPVVDAEMLEAAVEGRGAGAAGILVVDLGVPRSVEPAAATIPGVTVLDMDALRRKVEAAMSGRQAEVAGARALIDDELERYRVRSRERGAAPAISALRSRAEAARREELDRQRAKQSGLTDEQWDQVDVVTRSVMAKLLHQPTVAIKDATGTPRGERLIEALRILFDL